MRPKFQRLATFSCQGLNDKVKQTHIADDFCKFRLTAIMVQETRIKETGLQELTSSDGEKMFVYIIQAMEQNRSEESD